MNAKKTKDQMRGFRFVKFAMGTNWHECPKCGLRILSRGPWDFAPKADDHRKRCHLPNTQADS